MEANNDKTGEQNVSKEESKEQSNVEVEKYFDEDQQSVSQIWNPQDLSTPSVSDTYNSQMSWISGQISSASNALGSTAASSSI